MTRGRYWLFMAITLLTPFLLLGAVEVVLRVAWPAGAVPVFVHAPAAMGDYLMPNPELGRRYFTLQEHPPAPLMDAFAAHKPAKAFRVFVLGASSAAGFPWPPTGTFSHLLQDALRDVMPGDSVEVINLAIPATNTYAVLDQTRAVIAQHPDAVLIYSGHNEYYGALGVGSTESVGSSPGAVRAYLWLERFRTFMLLRDGIAKLRRAFTKRAANAQQAASFMEVVAGNQQITLGGPAYEAGVRQFRSNLQRILGEFRAAHVPVFIASLASNEGGMHPFASPVNAEPGGADAVFDSAQATEARGDTADAERLFVRARDLDVIRFRAPSEFNTVIREVAKQEGATYVPVVEAFRAASPGGIIGHNLILEHLHPNQAGVALIGHEFFDALDSAKFLGRPVQLSRLKPWSTYVAGMDITPFDRRMVQHTVTTLTTRWPFVPAAQDSDYRGTYRPKGPVDSLAFLASAGLPWRQAKLDVGTKLRDARISRLGIRGVPGIDSRATPGRAAVRVGRARADGDEGHDARGGVSQTRVLHPTVEVHGVRVGRDCGEGQGPAERRGLSAAGRATESQRPPAAVSAFSGAGGCPRHRRGAGGGDGGGAPGAELPGAGGLVEGAGADPVSRITNLR